MGKVKMIIPSDVKKELWDTVWQKSEKETIATNILKLSRFKNNDKWKPFTWKEYVEFCSHETTAEEEEILNDFAKNGYLKKDNLSFYHFEPKIIGVYMQYL